MHLLQHSKDKYVEVVLLLLAAYSDSLPIPDLEAGLSGWGHHDLVVFGVDWGVHCLVLCCALKMLSDF